MTKIDYFPVHLEVERGDQPSVERRSRTGYLGNSALATAALLAMIAIILPSYVADRLIKFPAQVRQVIASGTGTMADLDLQLQGRLHVERDVPIELSTLVTTVGPTDSETVTLRVTQQSTRLDRSGRDSLLDALVDQVSMNRTTPAARRSPALTVFEPGQRPLETVRNGLQYKFPFDTGRRDYPYFDVISQQEIRLRYIDEATVRAGLRLLHFRADINPVELSGLLPTRGPLTLPARMTGRTGDEESVTMSLYYSATRDLWVDPVTGAIIVVSEHQRRYLATAIADPAPVTVFDGNLRFDEQTIDEMISQSQAARERIAALRTYGPVAAAITAMVALAFGVRRLTASRRHAVR
ncbi:DUF3068 domain-containing protein [Nocardia abscessus]|uniref:DUF3068 domain-containing protein n=1 Tax=Nocardia abscessus TaxID=120957 RepID=UPI0002F2D952|nr:DUF3068 domain-containing protein [Nocardia abscessus]MCC3332365.1 DUF3068 domain-containing protein [Nocardia abscessus]